MKEVKLAHLDDTLDHFYLLGLSYLLLYLLNLSYLLHLWRGRGVFKQILRSDHLWLVVK